MSVLHYKLLTESQEIPYEILLLADETVEAIDKYVHQSYVYLVSENSLPVAVFCLYPVDAHTIELKNIAVIEKLQGTGIGTRIIDRIKCICKPSYSKIIVGTPDPAFRQIGFYEKNGFVRFGRRENFYILNYEQPIYENGVQLSDMILLKYDYADPG